jgi:transcriptional regulator with XRE-family HTH domain
MSGGSSGASASREPGREGPDPTRIASPADFGRELTLARRRAGLAVRDLAARAEVPTGTVSGYLTGAHLPQPTYLDPFRRVLAVLGESGANRVRRWEEALLRVRRTPGKRSASVPSPYPGLRSFQPQDAELFFGRREVAGEIVRRVRERAAGGGGPLMVVGASGSGKSSLLRAGVIPALGELGFETELTVPGAQALTRLEAWAGTLRGACRGC